MARPRWPGLAREASGPGPRAKLGPVLAVVLGLVLLVVAALVGRPGQLSSTGAEQARQLAVAARVDGEPPPPIPVRPAAPAAADQEPPVALRIGALGVSAEVDKVGVDPRTGQLEVPHRADRLGWYRFGPGLDATTGSMVITGHVDTVAGPGAFYRLGQLEPADTIAVTGADGDIRTFQVVAREVARKSQVALQRYFARDGAPRLTLITCGGPFDRDSRRYRDNIVITAVPG